MNHEGAREMKPIIALLIVAATLQFAPKVQAQEDPYAAIFQIRVIEKSNGLYKGVVRGTGFFINSDGTALTVSHIASFAVRRPDKYLLIALVNGDMYNVSVVCNSKLPYDGLPENVRLTRDIAEIKLAPFTLPFETWGTPTMVLATAHRGDLPSFQFLKIGGAASGHVRIVGFGQTFGLPERWMVEGDAEGLPSMVARLKSDNTPFFAISYNRPATRGDSGAPMLNDQGEVVGILWGGVDAINVGVAEGVDVLKTPCR